MRDYEREVIEREIVNYLNNGCKVFIECGCLVDEIIGYDTIKSKKYVWQSYEDITYYFKTTHSVFPIEVNFADWDICDCEDFEGNLFVYVQ